MTKLKFFVLLAIIFSVFSVSAQNSENVTGKVLDEKNRRTCCGSEYFTRK